MAFDVVGNELTVGDTVAYISSPGGERFLKVGTVERINAKTVTLKKVSPPKRFDQVVRVQTTEEKRD
ncbi:hypothetical protein SPFL3102_03571 [Sporomusaceae bacterium FL31]|nr:hypothetical protein SPFL3101_00434 [Sporomusaceae bacterium FL31]GCE35720.1 hypothetical protein SPFL3102_03571 [Sporomusaceae bacterium]